MITMKYKKTKLVNYRQQRDNVHLLTVTNAEQIMTDTLTLQDENAR